MNTMTLTKQQQFSQQALVTGMKLRDALYRMNLQPDLIRRAYVVSQYGLVVAFYPLELGHLDGKLTPYQNGLHQLSTTLRKPMAISNSTGFRYAVLIEKPKQLPARVDLQRVRTGKLQLGVSPSRQTISVSWEETGHILVAGMTGYGKTNFIRSIAYQSLRDGFHLLLGDLSKTAFPMLKHHPGVLAVADNQEEYLEIVANAHQIIGKRELLYGDSPSYPENLEEYNSWAVQSRREPLPRVLVILDEYNSVATASSDLKASVESLANQGRKFGLTVILAAQDFSKEVLGNVRDQMGLAVAFKVKNVHTARNIGLGKANTLARPGLALTDRYGPLQVFFMDKQKLIDIGFQGDATPLPISQQEQQLFERALREEDGKMAYEQIM
ncbi:MAG: FtsK/SpoIIIE domain-containing protein, partial [Chloroflexota bacterium]|nr:FtsK/SpoIIIE domain-containing protein [Chloroflexota bacterium]